MNQVNFSAPKINDLERHWCFMNSQLAPSSNTMARLLCLAVFFLACFSISTAFDTTLVTSTPQRKTWFAKYVRHPALQNNYYTAGRLTTRELKYAAENGFKGIISVPTVTTGIDLANGERFPTTEEEREIAEMTGMEFDVVMPVDGKWSSMEQVYNMRRALKNVARHPVLVHCNSGLSAGFLLLAATAENGTLSSSDIYEVGNHLGLNFYAIETVRKVISEVTGEPVADSKVTYNTTTLYYDNAKRFHNNYAVGGQYGEHNLDAIKKDGFKTIINFRAGVTNPKTGKASQEEVTLLNVKDKTSRLGVARQQIQNLMSNRLNASLPPTYISDGSAVNFEQRNLAEFGDDIGYNEDKEKKAVEAAGLDYLHLPFGSKAPKLYGVATYQAYKDQIMAALEKGPVLFKCRRGYRAVIMALIAYGENNGLTAAEALNLGRDMGWFFQPTTDGIVIRMIEGVLPATIPATTGSCSIIEMSLFTVLLSAVTSMLWSV